MRTTLEESTKFFSGDLEGWKMTHRIFIDHRGQRRLTVDFNHAVNVDVDSDAPKLHILFVNFDDERELPILQACRKFFMHWTMVSEKYLVQRGDRYFDVNGKVTDPSIRNSDDDYFYATDGQTSLKGYFRVPNQDGFTRVFINAQETMDDAIWKEMTPNLKDIYQASTGLINNQ